MHEVIDYTDGKKYLFKNIIDAINFQEHLVFALGHDAEIINFTKAI